MTNTTEHGYDDAPPPDNEPAPPAPPHDVDTERALLGSMLLAEPGPRRAALEQLTASDFYLPAHAQLFDAIAELVAQNLQPDPLVVLDRLPTNRTGTRALDRRAIYTMQAEGSSVGAPGFIDVVARHAQRRRIMHIAADLDEAARHGDPVDKPISALLELRARTDRTNNVTPVNLDRILDGTPPEIVPTIWAINDTALIYPGRMHSFATEPSQGKTWVALMICAEQMRAGRTVLYLDLEADAPTMIERLRAIGVADDIIRERFLYVRLDEQLTLGDRLALVGLVTQHDIAVVVLDTLAAVLAANSISEDSNSEVLSFLVPVIRPLAQAGAAILLLDHVTKDKDTRGRWARGAGAKLGEVDAAFSFRTLEPFSRHRSGKLRVRLDKDRYGAIGTEGEPVAEITVTVADEGRHVRLTTTQPATRTDSTLEYQPTSAMTAISDFLAALGGIAVSKSRIEESVSFKRDTVRRALTELIQTGHVKATAGPRNSLLHTLITPYRETDETDTDRIDRDLIF